MLVIKPGTKQTRSLELRKSTGLRPPRPDPGYFSLRRFWDNTTQFNNIGSGEAFNNLLYYQHIENCVISNLYYEIVAEVSNPINALSNRIFKKGVHIQKSTAAKRYHSTEATMSYADRELQLGLFNKFSKKANNAERRLEDELRAWYLDLNVTDAAYMYFSFDYSEASYDSTSGRLSGSRLRALERMNPVCIQIPLGEDSTPGRVFLTCVRHRALLRRTADINELIDQKREVLMCRDYITKDGRGLKDGEMTCPFPLYPVTYVYNRRLSSLSLENLSKLPQETFESDNVYPLVSKEVVEAHKKDPRGLYGRSVIMKLTKKINIMYGLDKFGENLFNNAKYPYALVEVNALRNVAGAMKEEAQKQAYEDPDAPVWLEGAPANPGQPLINVHTMPDKLGNVPYTETRAAIRQEIASAYGVTHEFVNANETVGGTVGQNVQLQVTTEVVESDLRIIQRILDRVSEELHQGEDGRAYYTYVIPPPDDKAETVRMATQMQKINMVNIASGLGLVVTTDGEHSDITEADFYVMPGSNRLGQLTVTEAGLGVLQALYGLENIDAEGIPENLSNALGNLSQITGGEGGQLPQTVEKAMRPVDRLFRGGMGGQTPTKENKVPEITEGATKNNPNKSGMKSKMPRINPKTGEVANEDPSLKGDLNV